MLKIGDTYSKSFSYTQDEVNKFADLSGDFNPIHLDAEFAAATQFKRPIIHGILGVSIFSKVLGTEFPGEGTIYLKQESEFKRPMFVDTVYESFYEVTDFNERRNHLTISTTIKDKEKGKVTVTGFAVVMVPASNS